MRYFITFLIGIGLVVLLIILLVRAIFGGGGETPTPRTELVSYANSNVVMRLTIDGPISADETHKQIRIDVSQYSADLRVISGYEGHVERSTSTPNNPTSYANFLRGLDLLGYTNGNSAETVSDERGYCPAGKRYIFEIIDGGTTKQRFWSTSCKDDISYKGKTSGVLKLFKAQIPDYREQTRDTKIQ